MTDQNRPVMVLHGPALFDLGEAAWLMARIRPARTIVAGVMARTAAEESGLPVEYAGSPPSTILGPLGDAAFLANHGKTPESGRIFGSIVASRLGDRGLVQVECADRTIIVWGGGDPALARTLADRTGFSCTAGSAAVPDPAGVRAIRGCLPGEPVYVNGIIIGRATDRTVLLRSTGPSIEALSGLQVKPHGLEKAARRGAIDLGSAWCKSGPIRSALPSLAEQGAATGRIAIVDHCGHELYARLGPDCCGILAIGDDTTAVCGHICSHAGIPVLGIVDGDRDAVVPESFAPGSVVLRVLDGRDDDLGAEVARTVPAGPVVWDGWVAALLSSLKGRVCIALDRRRDRR